MPRSRPVRRPAVVVAVVATLAGVSHAQPAASPAPQTPVLTKGQAAEGFYLDVARCLSSREHDGGVADLPAEAKAGLRPALPSERRVFKDPATKVWTTDLLGSLVLLAEIGPDKCQVLAEQLPVDATFRQVVDQLHKADPALRDDPVKPDDWPFAYQMERNVEASRFTVRLEGSEPGGLAHPLRMAEGHAYRFSMLIATIERSGGPAAPGPALTPAPAAPAPPRTSPTPQACSLTLPTEDRGLGPGTVQGFESQETSVARVFATQRSMKAQIDPDYADTPRAVVLLDNGDLMAVATLAAMELHPGDRVEVLGMARNPALPCNYRPPRVGSKLGPSR